MKRFYFHWCEPCTRPVLPNQHEREGRWWWEEATHKECGLHAGNLKIILKPSVRRVVFVNQSATEKSVPLCDKIAILCNVIPIILTRLLIHEQLKKMQ